MAKPNFLGVPGDQGIIDNMTQKLERFAAVLDVHMQDRLYVVGDSITLADYSMIHVEFFKEMIPFDWAPYPNLNAYFERLRTSTHWLSTEPASPDLIGKKPEIFT
ncbi:Uncharacterised protein [BD1-7 clade bacterium]|uniref:GST C-terminal domain-containing protein n=1 Tax=BD1-7 clade bacterium TaxID=2029982 RepID=A0A5S9P7V1_9GAMM|nr:Uncharacterised protein [BD1-7 clade bacterium]